MVQIFPFWKNRILPAARIPVCGLLCLIHSLNELPLWKSESPIMDLYFGFPFLPSQPGVVSKKAYMISYINSMGGFLLAVLGESLVLWLHIFSGLNYVTHQSRIISLCHCVCMCVWCAGRALQCYKCDSTTDPGCQEQFDASTSGLEPIDCGADVYQGQYCIKTTGMYGGKLFVFSIAFDCFSFMPEGG